MTPLADLRVKIFADGADLESMRALAERPYVRGFTTNPTLMHSVGNPRHNVQLLLESQSSALGVPPEHLDGVE